MWIIFWVIGLSVETLNASYNKIQTLQGEVTKYFSSNQISQTTIGKFYLKNPNKLFIKYAKPEQTIILNDTLLWVYLPAEKKAVKKNYAELSELEKKLIGIESFLGLNPIYGLEGAFEFEAKDESTIVGKPKAEAKIISQIVFNIDPQRNIILGTKIFALNGELMSLTYYEKWEEIDSVWFPQKVLSETYAGKQKLKEESVFQHIKINQEIDDKQFNLTFPEGVEIMDE